jgi:murein DD-endopeptidase MepM/ murein hydrolase activator NlpD
VTPDLVPPAKGILGAEFSPVNGRFGVEIVTADQSPVVAAREGTVIFNGWTPEEGDVVQIQHPDKRESVYRHLSETIPGVGTRVKAGEVIGVAGPLIFELWHNGTAIDPVNYIVF